MQKTGIGATCELLQELLEKLFSITLHEKVFLNWLT